MSNIAYAVIGAGYGDEGKGLVTDFLVRHHTKFFTVPLVIRGNGGAQAGHTVVVDNEDRERHVFSHVGSGTFAGANTYLASNFIVNPYLLDKEMVELKVYNIDHRVFVNRNCRVTTIYDMAINSLAELSRSDRHGSCGAGINETVARHKAGFHLTLGMVKDGTIYDILKKIQNEWVPNRLKELGISTDISEWRGGSVRARARAYIDMFNLPINALGDDMLRACRTEWNQFQQIDDPLDLYSNDQVIIYEGAQGLMLDEHLGIFPHVTRSVTGLPSAIQAAYEVGHTVIQPIYVTRPYLTRHGAGELAHEGKHITSTKLYDDTNSPNEWQGTLRYAPLDVDNLRDFIIQDVQRGRANQLTGTRILPPQLVVTCMDQLGAEVTVSRFNFAKNQHEQLNMLSQDLPHFLAKELKMKLFATSHGPTASDVRVRLDEV